MSVVGVPYGVPMGVSEAVEGEAVEVGAGEDVARQERHDEPGREGGYHGAFAHPLDMARAGQSEQEGGAYQGDVEDYLQASEVFVVAPGGVFNEPFGAHYGHVRF